MSDALSILEESPNKSLREWKRKLMRVLKSQGKLVSDMNPKDEERALFKRKTAEQR